MKMDVIINGVGGQGVVLASRVIAQIGMEMGWAVRTSETIGMAQRDGSVTSQVRLGEKLYGALIPDGGADIILGFELAETVRALHKLAPGGMVIANTAKIIPPAVTLGRMEYREDEILAGLKEKAGRLILLDAHRLASQAGNYKTVNMVLLGVLGAKQSLLPGERILETALSLLPEKLRDVNRKAFALGREFGEGC